MLILKLAMRALLGAGLRTWLNTSVLSLAFVVIIVLQGMYNGMNEQATRNRIKDEIGGGQLWHDTFDPLDPLSFNDAHGLIPENIQTDIDEGKAAGILVRQASIYPEGRLVPLMLKGIPPHQKVLDLPMAILAEDHQGATPMLIGRRMATRTGLKEGDLVTVRWRDAAGTFDARDMLVARIFDTDTSTVDFGQAWVALYQLQELAAMPNEATLIVFAPDQEPNATVTGWNWRDLDYLLADIREMVKQKTAGGSVTYMILLFMAGLTIFNSQVLSIFRRRREIGTLVALGMTRFQVVRLFTTEGGLHSVLATLVGAVYGVPLLYLMATKGIPMGSMADQSGVALGTTLFPVYSAGLILGTMGVVFVTATVVSWLPAQKISQMNTTDALKGKLS